MAAFGSAASSLFVASVLVCCVAPVSSQESNFSRAGKVSKDDVERKFVAQSVAGFRQAAGPDGDRFAKLEAELKPMFDALPKDADGLLGHDVVRYALHRLLVQRHGWFIKGLESASVARMKDWVPDYLLALHGGRKDGRGCGLADLVVVAATLQSLIRDEAIGRLKESYRVLGMSTEGALQPEEVDQILGLYLMVYLQGGKTVAHDAEEAAEKFERFKRRYAGWKEARDWLTSVHVNVSRSNVGTASMQSEQALSFELVSNVADAVSSRFGEFNDLECADLKKVLVGIEDRRPGRVRLSAFYAKALHSHWQFTEKVDYLRTLGALDESDPSAPSVIVPNYIGSRPQCLEASAFYAVCCRNECEDIMLRLERELAEPFALPERVAELVAQIPSDTVTAPRKLSDSLISRLHQVAAANGGHVPLHGRLFAQWMHHAFPRECPYPHATGTTAPQTPDEWMKGTGQVTSTASEEEMVCHVHGPCAGGSDALQAFSSNTVDASESGELPWSDAEELFANVAPTKVADVGSSKLDALNHVLRTVGLAGVALGLAFASKHAFPLESFDPAAKVKSRGVGWWATMGFFLLPLFILSVDLFSDVSAANEVLACFLSWGLAVAIVVKLRVQRGVEAKHDASEADRSLV